MSSNGVEAWFAAAAEGQRPTLEALRELILTVAPEVTEEIKWGRPCYSNARGLVCYLHHTKSYATLGFYKGAELDDPEGLLEGTWCLDPHEQLSPGQAEEIDRVSRAYPHLTDAGLPVA